MAHARGAVVQRGNRRYELTNQPRRRRILERNRALAGAREDVREAHAAHVIGDDDDRRAAGLETLDGADAAEGLVSEICDARGLFAQSLFERGDTAQLVADLEHLQRLVGGTDRVQPLPEAVFER